MTAISFLQAWRWARVNPRRQAAARGDTILASLAVEQPVPNERALTLPYTIAMKPRKLQDALLGLALAVGVLLLGLVYWRISGDCSQWVAILIVAGVFVVIGLLAPVFPGSRISVMSHGLKVHWKGEMLWGDVRLFAIRGGKPGTPATRYELATETRAVEWKRLRRIRWFSAQQPELPFEEYDREMDALLAVIAAKIGLPLYDLR
jgi:hypothetical protein